MEDQNRERFPNENLGQDNSSDPNKNSRAGSKEKNQPRKGSSESAARENTTTEGYGSSQRRDQENVGPLDADLNELPSKRRSSGDNTTGSGLG